MLHIVRRSELIGWLAIDSATASNLGTVEEVWVNESGRIAYLSSQGMYLPLEQVAGIGMGAITVYHVGAVEPPQNLHRLHQFVVQSPVGESLGWVEDFLFDWQTGEIAAYILAGEIAASFGGKAVLYPEDVEAVVAETVVIRETAQNRLKGIVEGLQGFLSEKPQQVKNLVRWMGDRLHHRITPEDHPEVVKVKITETRDELAASGEHDHSALQEATDYLQEQWQHLQHSVSQASSRARAALESTWKQLAGRR